MIELTTLETTLGTSGIETEGSDTDAGGPYEAGIAVTLLLELGTEVDVDADPAVYASGGALA